MMPNVLNEFNENIRRVKELHSIYELIKGKTTEILDISDILRAEIVLIVSALDSYIHNKVRYNMINVFKAGNVQTDSFKKFKIPLEDVQKAIKDPSTFDWLENEIITQHSWKSFQQSKKIEEAIALISSKKLWKELGEKLNESPDNLKNRLDVIVDRRNKIAHEADIDPSFPGQMVRWPINSQIIIDIIKFMEELVKSIDEIVKDNK